mgnify:CR=1 FL=1
MRRIAGRGNGGLSDDVLVKDGPRDADFTGADLHFCDATGADLTNAVFDPDEPPLAISH